MKELFSTFVAIILGHMEYRNPRWKSWNTLREQDFLDLPIAAPELPRLTFKLRQEPMTSEVEVMPVAALASARAR